MSGTPGLPPEPLMDLILQRAADAGLGRKAFILDRFDEAFERNWWRWVGGQTVGRGYVDLICNTLGVHPATIWPDWDTTFTERRRFPARGRTDHAWKADGACVGHDLDIFFPVSPEDVDPARAICATCPVFDRCYEVGLREHDGVWAGTTERERIRLRKQLGIRIDFDNAEGLEVA